MSGRTNRAAWLTKHGQPLEVKEAPYPSPKANYIVVRTRAVAINPIDWMVQEMGSMFFSWVKLPFIPGYDLAGDVLEVGSDVKRFQPGDRIVGIGLGILAKSADAAQGAFQECVLVREDMCAPVPRETSYEQACVIGLGLCTAACGLYQNDHLNLKLPTVNGKSTGQTLLIWGGSTSVGLNAIQLARASGYEVYTTCSPRNFDLVKSLGAAAVWDYNSPTVVADIIAAFKGKDCAGAMSIGAGAVDKCIAVLSKLQKTKKFVSMITYPVQATEAPKGVVGMASLVGSVAKANAALWAKCLRSGIKTKFPFGTDLEENEVGPAVWKDFLGDAMAAGVFRPSPAPEVVPTTGLEAIQDAFALYRKGVSAKKVVVTI